LLHLDTSYAFLFCVFLLLSTSTKYQNQIDIITKKEMVEYDEKVQNAVTGTVYGSLSCLVDGFSCRGRIDPFYTIVD